MKNCSSYNTTIRDAWFGDEPSGIDGGIGELVDKNIVDISAAGGLLREARIPCYDFLLSYFMFR